LQANFDERYSNVISRPDNRKYSGYGEAIISSIINSNTSTNIKKYNIVINLSTHTNITTISSNDSEAR
jgi:hypothetical protein